ncbi:hypothetical protein DFH09DRAFT_1073643 [Mycena vulgaris]|nr:hypothetical protein DFH09DRAFT_1073643 [Mycena vulgaris]
MQKADTLLSSAHNPYLDDCADVQCSLDEGDQYEDDEDEDLSEAQIRGADEEDFNIRGILAEHDIRVLSADPYRILERFLQSGADTPLRGEEWDLDIPPSRAPTSTSRFVAPTPAYNPPDHPSSESIAAGARRSCTPLFLPNLDSHGPTLFQPRNSHDFTPYVSPLEAHKLIASSTKRVRTASPLRNEARAQRVYPKIAKYLDTIVSDSNKYLEEAEDEDEEIRDSDGEIGARFESQAHKLLMVKAHDIPPPPASAPNKRQQKVTSGKKKEQDAVPDLCCTNKLGGELYQMDYPESKPSSRGRGSCPDCGRFASRRNSICVADAGIMRLGSRQCGATHPQPVVHIFDCVTVALPVETDFDEVLPSKMQPDGTQHINVPMEDINRHFVLGDVVFIVRGENKNRHGLVVHIHSDGSLEVSQTGYGLEVVKDVDVGPASTLNSPGRSIIKRHKTGQFDLHDYQDDSEFCAVPICVMRANVDFLMFDEDQLTPNRAPQVYTKTSVVEAPRVSPALPHLQKDQAGQVAYQGNNKGFCGQVVSTYHTQERYKHLKSQKRRRFMEGDTRGIMVTIRNNSNRWVAEPIEKGVHDMTHLPLGPVHSVPDDPVLPRTFEEHHLPGELDGRWLLMPGLVGKHMDVEIRGLLGFMGTRDIPRLFNMLVACDGSRGTLLLMGRQTESNLRKFPASCIKPARVNTHGVDSLTRIQRVVVLGPDVTEDTSLVVIRVNRTSPVFFHTLHLCLVKNKKASEVLPMTFPH